MLFQAGAVSFLVRNNFDFNKLFAQGINFGRFSEEQKLRDLCVQKVTKNFESMRSYSQLSKTHQAELERILDQVDDFVYNTTSPEQLVFQI
jgi:hypothetical protein